MGQNLLKTADEVSDQESEGTRKTGIEVLTHTSMKCKSKAKK